MNLDEFIGFLKNINRNINIHDNEYFEAGKFYLENKKFIKDSFKDNEEVLMTIFYYFEFCNNKERRWFESKINKLENIYKMYSYCGSSLLWTKKNIEKRIICEHDVEYAFMFFKITKNIKSQRKWIRKIIEKYNSSKYAYMLFNLGLKDKWIIRMIEEGNSIEENLNLFTRPNPNSILRIKQ